MSRSVRILIVLGFVLFAVFVGTRLEYLTQHDIYKKQLAEEEAAHNKMRALKDAEIEELTNRLEAGREAIKRLESERERNGGRSPGRRKGKQPVQTGKVLAVNNESNVYVISLGDEDGVRPGFQYIVSRGTDYIATIQISDVQDKQSAGFAMKDLSKDEIRRGDTVMNGQ